MLRPRSHAETITERERRQVVLLADCEEISMTWTRYAPGERGPDAHVHREHTDAFYVLEGELTFVLGAGAERIGRVSAGGFVAVPANVVHSFSNEGSADACFLNLHAPDMGFAASMRARRDGGGLAWDSFDAPADGGLPAGEAIVVGPGEGVKGVLPDLSVAEWTIDGPHPHRHDDQVDAFYVLEGELDVTVEGSVHTAGPETLALVPRGSRHTLAPTRAGKARFLWARAPGR